ncbi:hypothetical protein [Actinomadura roseirufa]|uniref:hypothetical protein n=1 Tax=Actinomadura roseirufa TaxID=2094049 RepID=UPI001F5E4026|nr:hypothetical protein [Actinomadura roseirufa]
MKSGGGESEPVAFGPLARRSHFTLVRKGAAWRLDASSALSGDDWPVRVEVAFEAPVPLRPERLIPQRVGWSERRRRVGYALPLRRPIGAKFIPRAYQRGRRRRA